MKIVCINLTSRLDRKKRVKADMKKQNLNFEFFKAKQHKNTKRGCLESHLTVIKQNLGAGNLMIIEDDIKFLEEKFEMPQFPDQFDMLYFGGLIHQNYNEIIDGKWVRMQCQYAHAYVINMNNKELVDDILTNGWKFEGEIDKFYMNDIHPKYKCYMSVPMKISQREGYSDIEKANVNYDGLFEKSLTGFQKPEHEINDRKEYILKIGTIKDDELPFISLVTPTRSRRHLFALTLHNYYSIIYPKEKMEWIIVEKIDEGREGIWDLLPKGQRSKIDEKGKIRYLSTTNDLSIPEMRNLCNSYATGQIIVHLDDDDYYPENSVLTRVKLLMKYPDIHCVGSSQIGVYNIQENKSTICTDGILSISEASMAYRKQFWDVQHFDIADNNGGEYRGLINSRLQCVMDVPYSFTIIALKHNKNYTKGTKQMTNVAQKDGKEYNFYDEWDLEFQGIIDQLRKIM